MIQRSEVRKNKKLIEKNKIPNTVENNVSNGHNENKEHEGNRKNLNLALLRIFKYLDSEPNSIKNWTDEDRVGRTERLTESCSYGSD